MVKKLIDIFARFRTNAGKFANQMKMPLDAFQRMGKATNNFRSNFYKNITAGQRFAINLRRLTHGMRGFRMEMLGVMFFGMNMQKFFSGLLKPALDMVGAFNIWNTTLAVLFLPTALTLLEKVFIPLMDFFINLPEPMQKAIGGFALLGLGIGAVLQTIGSLALGLGSVILLFSEMNFGKTVSGLSNVGTMAGTAKGGLNMLWGTAMKLAGMGILMYVGLNIMNRGDKPLTMADWLHDLGLSAIGAYAIAGPMGSAIAVAITMMVNVSKESIANARRTLETFMKEPWTLTPTEAWGTGYQGTIVPQEAQQMPPVPYGVFGMEGMPELVVNIYGRDDLEATTQWVKED